MSVCFVCFVLVNCLLNGFSICVGEMTVFSLKVIVECILPFVCVEDDVCENGVCSVYVWWRLRSEKAASVSVVNCVQFAFL